MLNFKIFYVYIYTVPALLSLIIIFNNGCLLGDFRNYYYRLDFLELMLILIQFLMPLVFICLMLMVGNKMALFKNKGNDFERFVLFLFVFVFFVTLFVGVVKVGFDNNVGGMSGILMSLVVKLNPYLLVGILSFSRVKARIFFICLFVCVLYSYKQVSLQGYLVVLFSFITFLLVRLRIKALFFTIALIAPFFVYEYIFDALTYIYTLRNQMRGAGDVDAAQIMALAVGRISSLSSYLYIRDSAFDFSNVSDFFSLGIFLERILGFALFDTNSPSYVFNMTILGHADYSIFLGLNGFLYALYESSAFVFMFNIIVIVLMIFILFQMMPYFDRRNRIFMFFLVMYMPLLSFDVWEISIVFQSLILINLLYFLYTQLSLSNLSYFFGRIGS